MVEKLRRQYKKRPGLFLAALCYLCGALLLLLVQLGGFVANRVLYATGALAPAELTVDDFTLVGLEQNGDTLLSVDADPQLILKDGGRRVENLVVELEYHRPPRMRTVFWAKVEAAYSQRQMAYSHKGEGKAYYLPVTGAQHLRFDPDTVPGTPITVRRIAINQPRPFWAFFLPSAGALVLLVVVPGFVASGLSILKNAGLLPAKGKVGETA